MTLALVTLLNSCLILTYFFLNINNFTQTLSAVVDFYHCRVLLKGKYLFSQPCYLTLTFSLTFVKMWLFCVQTSLDCGLVIGLHQSCQPLAAGERK